MAVCVSLVLEFFLGPLQSVNDLDYRTADLPHGIHAAALLTARQCGYDASEEILLHAEVIAIQWLATDSVKTYFAEFLDPPCSADPAAVVRIDWRTWAVPSRFDGVFETCIVSRQECIVIDVPSLLAGEAFTYGLGPEFNVFHWEDMNPPDSDPPMHVLDSLCSVIRGDWREDLLEYFDSNVGLGGGLYGLHPALRSAVSDVFGTSE